MGLLLVYLVLLPLALVVISSFRPGGFPLDPGFTLANYVKAYGDPGFPALLGATVLFALGSAALALEQAPFNIYTLPGMIFVQGLALVPTAYLFLSPAFANMDPNLEEAAIAAG